MLIFESLVKFRLLFPPIQRLPLFSPYFFGCFNTIFKVVLRTITENATRRIFSWIYAFSHQPLCIGEKKFTHHISALISCKRKIFSQAFWWKRRIKTRISAFLNASFAWVSRNYANFSGLSTLHHLTNDDTDNLEMWIKRYTKMQKPDKNRNGKNKINKKKADFALVTVAATAASLPFGVKFKEKNCWKIWHNITLAVSITTAITVPVHLVIYASFDTISMLSC